VSYEMADNEPIHTVSAVEAVTERLRNRILDGQLPAGHQVTEMEVAQQYRVSRPTAKSAIQILVSDELLRREANKPARIPRLSSEDVKDLFLVRIPLEVGIVRLIMAKGQIPKGMAQAVKDISRLDNAPPSKFVEADLRFHRLMVDSLKSHRLTRVYDLIQGEIHLSMVQSQHILGADRIAQEHGGILAAIEKGDEALAVDRMECHLKEACRDVARYLDEAGSRRSQI
jgi:DNA-binding GntR family transcriptional regulator